MPLWIAVALAGDPRPTCQTLALRDGTPRARVPVTASLPELEVRDPYAVGLAPVLTEHFALWDDGATPPEQLDAMGAYLEQGLEALRQWGYPAPLGTEAYRLNAYTFDPSGLDRLRANYGGFATVDDEGYPYLVIAQGLVEGLTDDPYGQSAIVHELTHTVHWSQDKFWDGPVDDWYWEAHAQYVVATVLPQNIGWSNVHIGIYTLYPHLSLRHWDFPDTGALVEARHYGAELFLQHLEDNVGDEALIHDAWRTGSVDESSLDAMARLLGERGLDFASVFSDFAVANVLWDYPEGELYLWMTDQLELQVDDARRLTRTHDSEGVDWRPAREESLPRGLGYNVIRIEAPAALPLHVGFEGDAEGSAGSTSAWWVSLVLGDGVGAEVLPLASDEGVVDVVVEADQVDGRPVTLVVVQASLGADQDESFDYRYRLQLAEASDADVEIEVVEEVRACGCAQGSGAPMLPAGLALGLAAIVRRRRSQLGQMAR